jgi:hypothetical protein
MIQQLDQLCEALRNGPDESVAGATAVLLSRDTRRATDVEAWRKLAVALSKCGYVPHPTLPFGPLDSTVRAQILDVLLRLRQEVVTMTPAGPLLQQLGVDMDLQYRVLTQRQRNCVALRWIDILLIVVCLAACGLLIANIWWNIHDTIN